MTNTDDAIWNEAIKAAASLVEAYALDEDELVKFERRKTNHRNTAIHSYACGELQGLYLATIALRREPVT